MALPAADEIWKATTTSLDSSAEGTDGWLYKVVEIVTIHGKSKAKLKMIGPEAQCAGFHFYIPAAYMDASSNWTIQGTPIP